MNKHLHQHPLIPTNDGQFLSSSFIWTNAVQEIYNFCQQYSLLWLWVYLWNEWYKAYWKVLKRDFLYKFFRPRLDLVVFIIMEKVISHQKRKFEQVFLVKQKKADCCSFFFTNCFFICKHLVQQKGIVDVPFFDQIHRCYEYPFLNTLFQINNSNQFLQITSNIETIENEKLKVIEKENLENEECEELYNHLIDTMEKSLEILKDQQSKKNFKWIKGVEKNFIPIQKMLLEITLYKRRRVMPRTFKDHSCNTMFFN
ncbi:hypothetical protein Glove_213g137 [Diversispora epigaea]|uniref:SWIM-type domain-containing protein n=1 Tax=Diversispora epigaea TaxID=1348612 RepID=A0A397IHS8_9GLOM|nr:hypothetical protein Glove_213g137 [Diversispora epigaea]